MGKRRLLSNILEIKDKTKCNYKVYENLSLRENYCEMAKFASSNCDAFLKEIVALPKTNVIKVDNGLDSSISVFSELKSVAVSIFR